jgi:hypothetical protein
MRTTIKCLTGGIVALLGGAILASAQLVGTNYILSPYFTNDPLSQVVYVYGLPALSSTELVPGGYGVAATDGSGRIDGVWDLLATNLTAFGDMTTGRFIADISGNITSVGKNPVPKVRMNVRGSGYIENTNGSSQATATINFLFTGLLSSNSSAVGPFETNVTVIDEDTSGNRFTNDPTLFFGSSNNITLYQNSVGYSNLAFYVNTSANLDTNSGTTNIISQHNEAYYDYGNNLFSPESLFPPTTDGSYAFGTRDDDTNTYGSLSFVVPGTNGPATNVFFVYSIGTNIDFQMTDTNVTSHFTNAVYAFDIAQIGAFIDSYSAGQLYAFTNGSPSTNFIVRAVITNSVAASTLSTNYPEVTPGLSYSDVWSEVSGKVKGAIRSGRTTQSLSTEMGTFGQFHYLYTQLGNDSNGVVVLRQAVNGNSTYWNLDNLNGIGLGGRVISTGKKIVISNGDFGYSGKGTLNNRRNTYQAHLRGVARIRGSSANIKGSTGPVIAQGINIDTLTNIAALPQPVTVLVTNPPTSITPFAYMNVLTNIDSGTNEFHATNFWREIPIPTLTLTNIPNAIDTINLNGKVWGQKVRGNGYNNQVF